MKHAIKYLSEYIKTFNSNIHSYHSESRAAFFFTERGNECPRWPGLGPRATVVGDKTQNVVAGTFQQKSTFSVKPQPEHLSDGDLGGRDEKLYENFGGPTHLSLEHKCFGGNRRHMSSHETNMHALIYFKGNKFVLQGK